MVGEGTLGSLAPGTLAATRGVTRGVNPPVTTVAVAAAAAEAGEEEEEEETGVAIEGVTKVVVDRPLVTAVVGERQRHGMST